MFDVDKNGRLSVSEVVNGLRVCGLNPTEREAAEIVDKIDKSGINIDIGNAYCAHPPPLPLSQVWHRKLK